ncbi:GNAT domain-containing protein [Collybia nuda]|uniref:GNAT domain-containing protein n=1 Tax=Collybia nuda TaxID=64659 RepID=A0A9P5Y8L9_9AGAR|nr:GNAT domain-containing protein [Collybia nuda]
MKINKDTVVVGEKVILVPYLPEHVPTYHGWMLSEELRLLTASEPLTLEGEFDMQRMLVFDQKWLLDDDKLTFIVLARDETIPSRISSETPSSLPLIMGSGNVSPSDPRVSTLPMIGDVNMFLRGTIPQIEDHLAWTVPKDSDENEEAPFEAEVEIMIAEPTYRRRGCALEALRLMLHYATGAPEVYFGGKQLASHQPPIPPSSLKVPPAALLTRISESNTPSICLFEKLGFKITKRVEVFEEVEMRWFHKG